MTMKIIGLALLLLCGCHRPKPPLETPAQIRFRASMEKTLEATSKLTFRWGGPIPDGGSWVFNFTTDSGASVELLFSHGRKEWGGNPDFQVIRICDDARGLEVEVPEKSPLEGNLIRLMKSAEVVPDSTSDSSKPTRKMLDWLVARTQDRRTRMLWPCDE